MKVELIEKTDELGDTKFWVYIDGQPKDCFTKLHEAQEMFDYVDSKNVCIKILNTKEV